MTNKFSLLTMLSELRQFKQDAKDGDYSSYRICRVPGDIFMTVVRQDGNENKQTTEDEIVYTEANFSEVEDGAGKLLTGVVLDAFELEEANDDDEQFGNVQAEELFTTVLESGFCLLNSSPYFELILNFVYTVEGFQCLVYLCRINYDKQNEQQVSTILFQSVYPLCFGELPEEESESTPE